MSEDRAARDAVLRWNGLAVDVAPTLSPNGPLAPFVEARLYAIANVAMHDAVNGVRARFRRYADVGAITPGANAAAAVIAAGHTALVGATPASAHPQLQAAYEADIAALRATGMVAGIDEGVTVGRRAALAVLAARTNDGTDQGVGPYTPGSAPGDYQFTFPFNTPGFDFFGTGGFAEGSRWGTTARTFVVRDGRQFRAPPPYGASSNAAAVRTARYTRDYDEVKAIGCDGCAARSPEQTEIARFWVENSPAAWNGIARTLIGSRRLDAWETARTLALVQLAEFDAYTTSLESKYFYNFWRPVTAMASADADGNPGTTPVAGWEVVAFPTPPVPDYPSAHAVAGGAAAAVLALVLGRTDSFSATSTSLPGVVRRFPNVGVAALENARSRVYVGYHFRHATDIGLAQGGVVGTYVALQALRPLRN
ncbi:MAG: vanadium-dependent haloperoxidase [Gemmatimonadaceae bacterium]|nr:vanadium-dependent haloperoxidase [Gemmatimonadaceae bacterium]